MVNCGNSGHDFGCRTPLLAVRNWIGPDFDSWEGLAIGTVDINNTVQSLLHYERRTTLEAIKTVDIFGRD